MRKTLLITTLVLILALVLAACGDTGGGAADTGAVDTGTTDTGAVDTGTTDTGAADTDAADTGAADTGAADTGAATGGDMASTMTGAFSAGTTNIEFGQNGAFMLGDDATGTYTWEGDELVLSGGSLCPDQVGRYNVSGDATAGFTFTAVDDPCTARSDMLTSQGAFTMGSAQ